MRIFLFLVFVVTSHLLYGQDAKVVDSLKQVVATETNDTLVMDAYNRLRREYYYADQKASHGYAIKYLEYAQKINDSIRQGIAYYYIANANFQLNKFSNAIENYLISSVYFEELGEKQRLPSVYSSIGSVYEKQGEADLALQYFNQTIALSKENEDLRRLAIGQANAASIYGDHKNDIDKAIELLLASIANIDKYMEKGAGQNNWVYKYLSECNLGNFYRKSAQYDKAKETYEGLIEKVDAASNTMIYYTALGGLGQVNLQQGNTKEALSILTTAYDKFEEGNFQESVYDILPDLIKAYEKEAQPEKALVLFKKYNILKDSVNDKKLNESLNDAMQRYESEKKERKIAQQELVIIKRDKQRKFIIYLLVTLGIILIGTYLFFKKRLKYQKMIASQEVILKEKELKEVEQKNLLISMNSMIEGQESERLRIAQDLHDSLGGLLSTVKAHFTVLKGCMLDQSTIEMREKTANLIDESCMEVRRISHNMIPHSLSISGLVGTLEDMVEYLTQQGYEATLEIRALPELPKNKEVMIYRLVQEIFSNIQKHAGAKTILLQLIGYEDQVHLMIEDDGVGFEYEYAFAKAGLGIKSINSRVEILKGTIHWDSQPEEGTCITITIPTN